MHGVYRNVVLEYPRSNTLSPPRSWLSAAECEKRGWSWRAFEEVQEEELARVSKKHIRNVSP